MRGVDRVLTELTVVSVVVTSIVHLRKYDGAPVFQGSQPPHRTHTALLFCKEAVLVSKQIIHHPSVSKNCPSRSRARIIIVIVESACAGSSRIRYHGCAVVSREPSTPSSVSVSVSGATGESRSGRNILARKTRSTHKTPRPEREKAEGRASALAPLPSHNTIHALTHHLSGAVHAVSHPFLFHP